MTSAETSQDDGGQNGRHADRLKWYQATVELAKAMAWPIAVLIIFISIRAPLWSTLTELPRLIQSAQKVTVGTVSIERKLRDAGIPTETRKALARLSRRGLVLLLDTGKLGFGYLPADWESSSQNAAALRELQSEGLVVITKSTNDSGYAYQYSLTDAAKNAYDIILKSIESQLFEDKPPIELKPQT